MRENSGKGDSNTGLLDPTMKEHEAERNRSGKASLKPKHKSGHQRTSSPDNRGGGGR
jgi:hypothetical protein